VKISVEDRAQYLLDRFSVEAAVQDPFESLPAQGLYKRSPQKISVQVLCNIFLSKIFVLFHQVSVQDL
jgi:hypothetical protein